MDAQQTAGYVERIRRRRRSVRVAWIVLALFVAASTVMLPIWGEDWACHYSISRENFAVPDLTGLRLDEAREEVPTCVEVEPTDAALADDDGARIVSQRPEPPNVLDHRRSVRVVLREHPD